MSYRPRRCRFRGPWFLRTRYETIDGRIVGLWQRRVDTGASWMATEVVYAEPVAMQRADGTWWWKLGHEWRHPLTPHQLDWLMRTSAIETTP